MSDIEHNSKRDYHLDALKGFAIILVIVGHITAFSNNLENLQNNVVFQLIYSFHMPLFFFVSGYLVFGRFGPTTAEWILKKFRQLIIPYILFTIFFFYILFGFSFNRFTITDISQSLFSYTIPNSAWFLPVLFESFLVLALLINAEKIAEKFPYVLFFLTVAIPLPLMGIASIPLVHQIVVYTPYVIAGYLVCSYQDYASEKSVQYLEIFGSILFPFLFLFKSSTFFTTINYGLFILYYSWLIAFAGIILSWVIVKFIMNYRISLVFIICGIFSLEIYLIHLVILNGFFAKKWPLWYGSDGVALVSGSIALLLLSLISAFILSYNEKISKFLFGRWSYRYLKNYLMDLKVMVNK
jgi:fucose 4-O-acetylase-like acetyltransferase